MLDESAEDAQVTLQHCVRLRACVFLRLFDRAEGAFVNVRLGEATLWETTAFFTVRVSNQTSEPIPLDGSVYNFYLNGQYVGDGMSSETVEIPRLSSATQEVTVHLRNVAMATRIRPIIESQALDYRVSSTFYLVRDQHSRRCRVEREGRLALQDFQPTVRDSAPSQ